MIDDTVRERFDAGLEAVERKDWSAAADAFWAACKRSPNNVQILFNLANARLQAGDKKGCRWAINRAMAQDPEFRNLRLLAGNLAVEETRYEEAVEHYEIAVKQDPQNVTVNSNLAEALTQLNRFEEAYECYEFSVHLGGDRAALYSAMFYVASHACRWDLTQHAQRLLDTHVDRGGQNSAAPFQLLCMNSTRGQQLAATRIYASKNWGSVEPLECRSDG